MYEVMDAIAQAVITILCGCSVISLGFLSFIIEAGWLSGGLPVFFFSRTIGYFPLSVMMGHLDVGVDVGGVWGT